MKEARNLSRPPLNWNLTRQNLFSSSHSSTFTHFRQHAFSSVRWTARLNKRTIWSFCEEVSSWRRVGSVEYRHLTELKVIQWRIWKMGREAWTHIMFVEMQIVLNAYFHYKFQLLKATFSKNMLRGSYLNIFVIFSYSWENKSFHQVRLFTYTLDYFKMSLFI